MKVKNSSLRLLVFDFEFREGLHELKRLGLVIYDGIVPIGLVGLVVMTRGGLIFVIDAVESGTLRRIESILHEVNFNNKNINSLFMVIKRNKFRTSPLAFIFISLAFVYLIWCDHYFHSLFIRFHAKLF